MDYRDYEILESLKKGIDETPINILENIKNQNVVKMIEHDDITKQSVKSWVKSIISFASLAAVFLLVFFNFQQLRLTDSEIYLDVNPGIHLTTNRKDQVIKLEAVNEEAIKIINEVEYKGKDLNEVTEDIIDSLLDKEYINKEYQVMLLSVFNKDKEKGEKQANELNHVIHNKLNNIDKKPILLTQALDESNTIEEYAKEYGISVGKMTFIRNMIILNHELKTDDLVTLSLEELVVISQQTGIDIESIVNGNDTEKIAEPSEEPIIIPRDDGDTDDSYDDSVYDKDDNDDHIYEDDYYDDAEYEIKIIADGTEYEIKIDAYTGKVIKFEKEGSGNIRNNESLIGRSNAKDIALELANGEIVELKLDDYDDDDAKYVVKIIGGGTEYEIEIDAYNGKVLEFDKESNSKTNSYNFDRLIGRNKAEEIALELINGKIVEFELDFDN